MTTTWLEFQRWNSICPLCIYISERNMQTQFFCRSKDRNTQQLVAGQTALPRKLSYSSQVFFSFVPLPLSKKRMASGIQTQWHIVVIVLRGTQWDERVDPSWSGCVHQWLSAVFSSRNDRPPTRGQSVRHPCYVRNHQLHSDDHSFKSLVWIFI